MGTWGRFKQRLDIGRTIGVFTWSITVGLYRTFVCFLLWGWFAVSILHLPTFSFWEFWGLMFMASFLFHGNIPTASTDRQQWATILEGIEICVPADKKEEWESFKEVGPVRTGIGIFSQSFGEVTFNSLILLLGFCIHAYLTGGR